ncbi:MAG: hypothetical protein A2W08_17190 [Candidatus Rokubacteria bacterium RBG_16_73_20]|nr:MAG: hypothetical protein A2050_09325 [Candidatus Rokubacteria bacterium GWA2_73_35]OGK95055.1 MAG: hypothetical protein A2W08_17190 [Candidatus Rokubacteria bacterium RBG_16_73_20]HBH01875.1 hypothetical protein [Candidatus Rokubacteria bacterium]
MKLRFATLAVTLGAALLAVATLAGRADAQVQICNNTGFATTSGTTACNGTANPVTATATVRGGARLTLDQIFGSAASGLTVAFGDVDAQCLSTPGAGISCAVDGSGNFATWYGDIQFSVKLTGVGATTAKLTGVRPAAGSIPAGQLMDGVSGGNPATAYPVSPSTAADLRTAIGSGNTTVTRAFGLRVLNADAAGAWSGNAVYSLVIE